MAGSNSADGNSVTVGNYRGTLFVGAGANSLTCSRSRGVLLGCPWITVHGWQSASGNKTIPRSEPSISRSAMFRTLGFSDFILSPFDFNNQNFSGSTLDLL
jgi:hypothetical protein